MSAIDRDILIKKYINPDIEKFHNSDVKIVLENLKQNILRMPSVDRPRGEWVICHKGTIAEGPRCSNCGSPGYGEKFCPNCGADMRKIINKNPLAEVNPKPIPTYKHTFSYRKEEDK